MLKRLDDSAVCGLSARLAGLELPITIKASHRSVQVEKYQSTLTTFGEVATFLSTPYVDDAISGEDYQNLDDADKHMQDMVAGSWRPGRIRNRFSPNKPSNFLQSYFVFDLIDFEPEEIDSLRTKGFPPGFGAVLMHTLRGHTTNNPKVRIIFPMFESITLLDAYFVQPEVLEYYCHLNLEGRVVGECIMDVDRPLALPSISEGEEFWFLAVDGAPIFADSIIDELEDN
jgi:hypothetical protein